MYVKGRKEKEKIKKVITVSFHLRLLGENTVIKTSPFPGVISTFLFSVFWEKKCKIHVT